MNRQDGIQVAPWTAPGVDAVAARLTAALVSGNRIFAPQQAVALFWQTRGLLLRGEPKPLRPEPEPPATVWDDPDGLARIGLG